MRALRLSKRYLSLLIAILLVTTVSFATNKTPQVFEIIGSINKPLDSRALAAICNKQHIAESNIYQWNNHLVVYTFLHYVGELKREITIKYPGCEIKLYDKPFYNFNRADRCGNIGLVKEWDNIILTANLVNDPKMQQEYLNYHATQFKKWPEVSNGFCNADFQQLLVFKNGRQLMLVIGIPKGADLDKLNPLTTKNNPRVNNWNNIMKKYQEGIPGTKPGETWVFLKPIK